MQPRAEAGLGTAAERIRLTGHLIISNIPQQIQKNHQQTARASSKKQTRLKPGCRRYLVTLAGSNPETIEPTHR
jgi:hypothetical protein